MKIKPNLSQLIRKLQKVPLKYLYIALVIGVLLIAGGTTILVRRDVDKQPSQEAVKTKDSHDKSEESTATKDGDQPVTSPTPTEQPPAAASVSPTGSTTKPPIRGKSGSGGGPATVAPELKDTQKPSTPTGLIVYNDPNHDIYRIIDWDASTDNVGVAGYRIYKRTNIYENYKLLHTVADGSSDDTDTYPMCSIMDTYGYYAVEAYDAAGNVSAWAEAKILDEPWKNCYQIGV